MLQKQLQTYYLFHQRLFTKITHLIGVPLIIFSLCIVFNWLELTIHGIGSAPMTWLIICLLTLFYCLFDWQVALISGTWMLSLAIIAFFWLGIIPSMRGFYIALICFFAGGFLQLIGHVFERKKPAFMQSAWQTLYAPPFVTLTIMFWLGFKQTMRINFEQTL